MTTEEPSEVRCGRCQGTGWVSDPVLGIHATDSVPCPECGGAGRLTAKEGRDARGVIAAAMAPRHTVPTNADAALRAIFAAAGGRWFLMGARWHTSPSEIECPEHGPMDRLIYDGVVVDVSCRKCGKQPIDLLETRHYYPAGGS